MQERTIANSRPEHMILTTLKFYTSGVVLDKRHCQKHGTNLAIFRSDLTKS